ncbi:arginine repressor [Corynebacterium propinquum]|uniref:Arginine repressor n=1 Tax=Corynebacterium propinquum TaxID=43769 RepID=A0ABT7G4T9_9CORY|nr:arginine repressor [Corynebacterium propinquum]MCG7231800.1 arginine repressor [Corynebacterium propinquum]MCT1817605.1 arginine repressor [Corynebacterium propinquum]MDK4233772.1 arginine repressor [Corynebacterium propinquum]MDK4239878.1 arginine repressor [Corynebacterium propinquum]MDK4252235.1 arginine repressor [Corynebacterium propinquum]
MTHTYSRTGRQARIVELLEQTRIYSQAQLSKLLLAEGFETTQATLSRDLDELGARKIKPTDGRSFYAVGDAESLQVPSASGPRDKLRKMMADLVVAADHSANTAVLRTPPGAAPYLASFIDRVGISDIVGTIAGDDTVFVLARDPLTGKELIDSLADGAAKIGPE